MNRPKAEQLEVSSSVADVETNDADGNESDAEAENEKLLHPLRREWISDMVDDLGKKLEIFSSIEATINRYNLQNRHVLMYEAMYSVSVMYNLDPKKLIDKLVDWKAAINSGHNTIHKMLQVSRTSAGIFTISETMLLNSMDKRSGIN